MLIPVINSQYNWCLTKIRICQYVLKTDSPLLILILTKRLYCVIYTMSCTTCIVFEWVIYLLRTASPSAATRRWSKMEDGSSVNSLLHPPWQWGHGGVYRRLQQVPTNHSEGGHRQKTSRHLSILTWLPRANSLIPYTIRWIITQVIYSQ